MCNTSTAITVSVPLQPNLFQSPPTWFHYFNDFEQEKHWTRLWTWPNLIICLLDNTDQVPLANISVEDLRANAQKYRAKRGYGQNLTNLYFEFIERYLWVFKGFGVLFSEYDLLAGKMDFALSLAKKMAEWISNK